MSCQTLMLLTRRLKVSASAVGREGLVRCCEVVGGMEQGLGLLDLQQRTGGRIGMVRVDAGLLAAVGVVELEAEVGEE
jgi:hypothetical protein